MPSEVTETMVRQIGSMNLMAISGLRIRVVNDTTVDLPVGNGYSVEVEYDPGWDLYNVRRIFTRSGVRRNKGELTRVYAEDLGETAYRASCFRNGPFGETPA